MLHVNNNDQDKIDPENSEKSDFDYIRDPFSDRSLSRDISAKRSIRSSRYRSTAKSRILGMSVGDIRYSFNQLRAAGDSLTSQLVLYNGQTAGEFALSYLIETSNSMRKRRKRKKDSCSVDEKDVSNHGPVLPDSQIQKPSERKHKEFNGHIMEF